MPQQRLSFAQWSQRRGSSISGDLLEFSSQQSDDLDVSQKSKCLSSRPRTVSTTSSTKPRTSWVFSHMPDEEVETRYYNQRTGKEEWRCKHCDKTYASSGGTAAPAKHLMDPPPDGHGLPKGAPRTAKVTTIRTIIEQARVAAEENPRKRRRLNDQSGDSIEPDQLEALYVRFITACSLPFRLVECPEFRALLAYINNDIETWLPDTHDTVKTWIMRQYECQKERVKQRIQSAKSRIHISCDLWTSPNSLAILGVVAHYVTEDGQLEHHVLALKDIDSEHDSSHLAVAILKVVDEWGFASKLGYFVMDNAGNNDTMMRSLSLGLLRRYDIQYDPKVHRLRCQGHIINLAAKAFLFVTDNEKLELDDPGVHNVTLKHIEAWRKKGPLGKIHNFVVFIQRSVQRSQKFLTISHNRKLARDNDTRWSSWYNMLRVALNLRDAIDGYFNKWMELDCAGDELSSEDWIILEKIKSFLEKLKMTTKALESSFATLDNVLLAMDFVLAQFEAGKEAYIDDPIMAPMYNSGWAKLDKYYRLTDESPAYVAAIVLHPSHKWHYIQENWKKEWAESSKKLMETLWNDYKPVESPLPLCEILYRHVRVFDHTEFANGYGNLPTVFQCVESWSQHLQQATTELCEPGTHLAVDEAMIRYTGRNKQVTRVPNKPVDTGFKVWIDAQLGIFMRWIWHQPGARYGPVGVQKKPASQKKKTKGKIKGSSKTDKVEDVIYVATEAEAKIVALNSTQSVVVALINLLPISTYHVFVDNLFSSPDLFRSLRQHGHGATGTARSNCGIYNGLVEAKKADKQGCKQLNSIQLNSTHINILSRSQ
ncbi:hypothetical protein HZS61_002438 [Fusarium oxysporum f. sp. conglutinans]|uniref:PiggyBac transposable element-derived protein domain-containing protein n=1 Tax=Fusarium oxysporum f. sp. conglutinans TaxID=100902 RepID=A0A8H6LGU8_FUSOX|nr:hypothetical protein HZS61_002438 [Fusarium oxysporum f. sp. conglutinans]